MIALAGQSESQQGRADSEKEAGCDFRLQANEGKGEQSCRKRILLERSVVWVLSCEVALSQMKRPMKISRTLVQSLQEKEAKRSGSQAE